MKDFLALQLAGVSSNNVADTFTPLSCIGEYQLLEFGSSLTEDGLGNCASVQYEIVSHGVDDHVRLKVCKEWHQLHIFFVSFF